MSLAVESKVLTPSFNRNYKPSLVLSVSLFFTLFLVSLLTTTSVFAKSIEQQRNDYIAAKKALDTKQYKTFGQIANTLKDYPLYPYLRYNYLLKRLWKVDDAEMIDFFKRYDDLPVSSYLRKSWLKLLIKRGHWQTFLDNYIPQSDLTLQCYQLQARIKTNNHVFLLEDTRSIWLTGKSLPSQCDPAFDLLYKSDLMTNELVWERVRLSMQNNQISLTNFLSDRLNPQSKALAKKWIQIHNNPYKYLDNPKLEDNVNNREILAHGILRLARQDIAKAVKRLEELKNSYAFIPGEIAEVERTLAIRAAKSKSKLASQLLDQIDNYHVNDEVFHYRLRTALANLDWPLLKKWTTGQAPDTDLDLRWRYWHARALEETGERDKAIEVFTEIAKERDYYAFLAADKINAPYHMNHYPLPENQEEFARIESIPAIKRAYEFYKLGESYPARREWYHAESQLTTYQMQMAAALVTKWGWHDRAIFAMTRANAYDNLVLRFPILFEDLFDKYAKKRNIDRSWIYGLARAESAFIEDVKSPAGALGLMQVMPKTGAQTAKMIGLKNFKTYKLTQAETNIPIGTAYMKQMLDKFDGNMVLATAAYNAGPHRVTKWLPKKGCIQPDVWIEQIPFNETRKYVRRVLYFANIYDWRLGSEIKPIKERMALVTANNKNQKVADLSCTAIKISDSRHIN
jgi:peptidoglycan lytic transglycosylase